MMINCWKASAIDTSKKKNRIIRKINLDLEKQDTRKANNVKNNKENLKSETNS